MATRLVRLKQGNDEFRFAENDRAVAEMLAAELPRLRAKAQELVGCRGPESVRILISDQPPGIRDLPVFDRTALRGAFWIECALGVFVFGIFGPRLLSGPLWLLILEFLAVLLVLATIVALVRLDLRSSAWPKIWALFDTNARSHLCIAIRWPRGVEAIPYATTRPTAHPAQDVLTLGFAWGLLRTVRRRRSMPDWFNVGSQLWLQEQLDGEEHWIPESQQCVREPETARLDYKVFLSPAREHMYRLCLRFYWEVRTLAEQGKLQQALRATSQELEVMRPKLSMTDYTE
jgi:hypothetical protein